MTAESIAFPESPQDGTSGRLVGWNILTIPSRLRALHEQFTIETQQQYRDEFNGLRSISSADKTEVATVVEYCNRVTNNEEVWVLVADRLRDELYSVVLVAGFGLTLAISIWAWLGGAIILYPVVAICASLIFLGPVFLADESFASNPRWRSVVISCALVLGSLLIILLFLNSKPLLGLPSLGVMWLRRAALAGFMGSIVTISLMVLVNGLYLAFTIIQWRRKNRRYPTEELVTDILTLLQMLQSHRDEMNRFRSAGDEAGSHLLRRLNYAFGAELSYVLEYTAQVVEGPWLRRLIVNHRPLKREFIQQAQALAYAIRSWKWQVFFNDDRLNDVERDFSFALIQVIHGRWSDLCPKTAVLQQPGKWSRVGALLRTVATVGIPLLIAIVILNSDVAPTIGGPIITLCIILPVVQLLSILDPKSEHALSSTGTIANSVGSLAKNIGTSRDT